MPVKPTIFCVTDVETTLEKKIVFDVAWRCIDRTGKIYYEGSFIITEAFSMDVPYFKEKLGFYFEDTWKHLIKPLPMRSIRMIFNNHISELLDNGHRVIFCAYNASFDAKHLGITSNLFLGSPFLVRPLPLMCIWHYWSLSCPRNYNAPTTTSGKFLSTSAESVYTFELSKPFHREKHIAWSDVGEECEILLKVLARKKKMPIVNHPKDLNNRVYKIANTRLGITGNQLLSQERK